MEQTHEGLKKAVYLDIWKKVTLSAMTLTREQAKLENGAMRRSVWLEKESSLSSLAEKQPRARLGRDLRAVVKLGFYSV